MQHWIHVYGRPLIEGSKFIKRFRAFAYKHKISAVGGFDTMSCQLEVTRNEADWFFGRLGSRIGVYIDNGSEVAWDGLLNRVSYTVGNQLITSSLDEMANRSAVTYSAPDVAAAPQSTTSINELTSQSIYGIKEGSLDGYLIRGTAVTKMDALSSTVLALRAYPQKSYTYNSAGGGQNSLLTIECLGLYHTLQWQRYFDNSTATLSNPDVILTAVLPTFQDLYFDPTLTNLIEANAGFTQDRRSQLGATYFEFFQSLQEAGDGSNLYVMGITPPDTGAGIRQFYYRMANTDIRYAIRSTDPKVRTVYGQTVNAWNVRPDCGVRVMDIATNWNGIGDDPATFYIDSIEYDGETQSVTFASADNLALEGIFGLNNYFKGRGKRFGATIRQVWS